MKFTLLIFCSKILFTFCITTFEPAHELLTCITFVSTEGPCASALMPGLQIFFQDWWAEVTHGAKNGGSFSEMMGPYQTKHS